MKRGAQRIPITFWESPVQYVSSISKQAIRKVEGWVLNDSPLHDAIKMDDLDAVEELIQQGVDINAKNRIGQSPIHYAAESSNPEIVRAIARQGAEVSIASDTKLFSILRTEAPGAKVQADYFRRISLWLFRINHESELLTLTGIRNVAPTLIVSGIGVLLLSILTVSLSNFNLESFLISTEQISIISSLSSHFILALSTSLNLLSESLSESVSSSILFFSSLVIYPILMPLGLILAYEGQAKYSEVLDFMFHRTPLQRAIDHTHVSNIAALMEHKVNITDLDEPTIEHIYALIKKYDFDVRFMIAKGCSTLDRINLEIDTELTDETQKGLLIFSKVPNEIKREIMHEIDFYPDVHKFIIETRNPRV